MRSRRPRTKPREIPQQQRCQARPKPRIRNRKRGHNFVPESRPKIGLEAEARWSRPRLMLWVLGSLTSLFISERTYNLQLNDGKRQILMRAMASLPPICHRNRKGRDLCSCVLGHQNWISVICPTWHITHLVPAAAGLMSSLARLKTCRLRRTVKKTLIVIIRYSSSQRTCTELWHSSFHESIYVQYTGDRRFTHIRIVKTVPRCECHNYVHTVIQWFLFVVLYMLISCHDSRLCS